MRCCGDTDARIVVFHTLSSHLTPVMIVIIILIVTVKLSVLDLSAGLGVFDPPVRMADPLAKVSKTHWGS